ncbi:MAG: nuclear transport factor 2 family protein, partial [Myxococcota bacterium]
GRELRTHVNGATANRVSPMGAEIFGTMKIHMFEADGSAPDSDLLFLGYEGQIRAKESKVFVHVTGRFIGGTGRYANASGEVELTSVNGFFDDGWGTLSIDGELPLSPPSENAVRQWVQSYFDATQTGDANAWAARFAEDALVEDPFGTEPVRGSEALKARGEAFLSSYASIGLHEEFVAINGSRAVASWVGRGQATDGTEVSFRGVNVFEFDEEGRIHRLQGYWNP